MLGSNRSSMGRMGIDRHIKDEAKDETISDHALGRATTSERMDALYKLQGGLGTEMLLFVTVHGSESQTVNKARCCQRTFYFYYRVDPSSSCRTVAACSAVRINA